MARTKETARMSTGPMAPQRTLPSKRQHNRVPVEKWEAVKDLVHKLYLEQNQTLDEVMEAIAEGHDLNPRYEAQLSKRQLLC